MQRLSLPDTKLLKWNEEDKAVNPEAATLGAELSAGLELFKDLQQCYLLKEANNDLSSKSETVAASSYEDPVLVTLAAGNTNACSNV